MVQHRGLVRTIWALSGALLAAGCQTSSVETAFALQPVLSPVTVQNAVLRELPAPEQRIVVSVYDFPDLTGQYKERENVQSLSRAVTQGGSAVLIKALQDAGERRWFSVLDRAELDDLLKERQIVTEMRRIYRNEQQIDPDALPPLRHASIIMQGGIVGYDTNTMTGGLGARYLGIGANTEYRQDTATVTLRAVSTNTGEVLASVTVHKKIASTALQGGAFRYIFLDRILEAEAGVTQNEPKQLAVQQAIDKAVRSLIIEGADLGVWRFADQARGREVIEVYLKEKYGEELTLAAQTAPAPDTPNPTRVVETQPRRPAPVRVVRRQPQAAAASPRAAQPAAARPAVARPAVAAQPAVQNPAPAGPQAPPPAEPGETLGSLDAVPAPLEPADASGGEAAEAPAGDGAAPGRGPLPGVASTKTKAQVVAIR